MSYKKWIYKYKYLEAEMDEIQEKMDEYTIKFNNDFIVQPPPLPTILESYNDVKDIEELIESLPPKKGKELYKELAKEFHPDKGGDEEDFKKLNELYQDENLLGMYVKAEEIGLEVKKPTTEAPTGKPEGEVKQLIALNNLQLSIDDYYQIIQAKTAALFSAACEVNGIIAGLTEQEKTALRQYGTELGIAFQLSDDVLDYQGCTDMMGKTAGDDFSEQKVTLPVLFAWQNSNIEERKFWEQTLKKGEQKKEDFAKAQRIMKKTHALKKTLNLALIHAEKAKKSLEIFPDTLIKSTLEDLALSIVERLY